MKWAKNDWTLECSSKGDLFNRSSFIKIKEIPKSYKLVSPQTIMLGATNNKVCEIWKTQDGDTRLVSYCGDGVEIAKISALANKSRPYIPREVQNEKII